MGPWEIGCLTRRPDPIESLPNCKLNDILGSWLHYQPFPSLLLSVRHACVFQHPTTATTTAAAAAAAAAATATIRAKATAATTTKDQREEVQKVLNVDRGVCKGWCYRPTTWRYTQKNQHLILTVVPKRTVSSWASLSCQCSYGRNRHQSNDSRDAKTVSTRSKPTVAGRTRGKEKHMQRKTTWVEKSVFKIGSLGGWERFM